MARIRSIKPEFPQSESMGRVSRDARLLFVLLWTIADDHGRARAHSRMLASLLFPYDEDAGGLMQAWLEELENEGCIKVYEVKGSQYLQILKWSVHQKIDRPSKPQFPGMDEATSNTREDSRECREGSSEEGKGREGKGEEGNSREDSRNPPAITFKTWINSIPEGEDAIPPDDPVYAYAERVGLPEAYLRLEWAWFKAKYLADGKRQKSWPQKFRNAVEGGWGNLWRLAPDGQYFLTTQGQQLERSVNGSAP